MRNLLNFPGQIIPPDLYCLPAQSWLLHLIIPALKVEKSWLLVKANLLAWLRGKEQINIEAG